MSKMLTRFFEALEDDDLGGEDVSGFPKPSRTKRVLKQAISAALQDLRSYFPQFKDSVFIENIEVYASSIFTEFTIKNDMKYVKKSLPRGDIYGYTKTGSMLPGNNKLQTFYIRAEFITFETMDTDGDIIIYLLSNNKNSIIFVYTYSFNSDGNFKLIDKRASTLSKEIKQYLGPGLISGNF